MWELTLLAWSWHHLKLLLCSVSMNYLTWLQCHPWYPSTTSNSQMHAAANAQQLRMRMKQKQTPWKEMNLQSTNFAMLIALSKILTNHGNICIPVPFSVGDIEAVHRAFSSMQVHSVEHSHCVVSCQARCKATKWFESTRWNGHETETLQPMKITSKQHIYDSCFNSAGSRKVECIRLRRPSGHIETLGGAWTYFESWKWCCLSFPLFWAWKFTVAISLCCSNAALAFGVLVVCAARPWLCVFWSPGPWNYNLTRCWLML